MIKTFKNLLLWNLKADDLETWFAASSTQVLPSGFKWYIDIDLFYGKSDLVPYALYGRKLKQWIFQKLL